MKPELRLSAGRFFRTASGGLITAGIVLTAVFASLDVWTAAVVGGILLLGGLVIRFARAEMRHDAAMNHIETLRGQIESIEAQISATSHVRALDTRIESVASSIEALDASMRRHDQIIWGIARDNASIHDLPDRFAELETSFAAISGRRAWTSSRGGMNRHDELHLTSAMATLGTTKDGSSGS